MTIIHKGIQKECLLKIKFSIFGENCSFLVKHIFSKIIIINKKTIKDKIKINKLSRELLKTKFQEFSCS